MRSMLKIFVMLDSKPTRLSEAIMSNLSYFLFGYLIDATVVRINFISSFNVMSLQFCLPFPLEAKVYLGCVCAILEFCDTMDSFSVVL